MIEQVPKQISKVETMTFPELFQKNKRFPLSLDTYQRPYVWNTQKVSQLYDDLRDFLADEDRAIDYYMGTLLLHRNAEKGATFVIDGQQRLTTLLILYHTLTGKLPEGQAFEFRSPQSERNVRAAQALLFNKVGASLKARTLFPRISFTVVIVPTEDLAFTFFDTQNHRGVPLNATDLLKAFHLRAITGDTSEALQTDCAARWEHMQRQRQIDDYDGDVAPILFEKILWRARRWRGQGRLTQESHDDIVDEFQTRCIRPKTPETVPLYPARLNTLASSLNLSPGNRLRLELNGVSLGDEAIDLPFSIRQPVSQGLGFFLYADKYAALAELLLRRGGDSPTADFRNFYHSVIAGVSIYLREFFLLASLTFADRFGFKLLYVFALWLDHVLGAIRLSKYYIFEAAPRKYLQESEHNLLDVIAAAYTPDEVIDFLQNDQHADEIYEAEEIPVGHGVRGAYKQRVLEYFGREDSLAGKRDWIADKIKEIA